jgi:hypothetical protein
MAFFRSRMASARRGRYRPLECVVLSKGAWAGGSHVLSLGFVFSLAVEPELAPCGWLCLHWRPTVMGSLVKSGMLVSVCETYIGKPFGTRVVPQ